MSKVYKKVALIPARAGSKRVPDKNIRLLGNHPLLAYSISAAISSEIFDEVVCVTDSPHYAELAETYGASVPFLRPNNTSTETSPDISWINWTLSQLKQLGKEFDTLFILRPTSPFRQAETIIRAWDHFIANQPADSLRAVRKCSEHPGKMWKVEGNKMTPLLPFDINGVPWHSNQYAALPEFYVQDASLEIVWTRTILEKATITGENVIPFISQGYEGFDINVLSDLDAAEKIIEDGLAVLPVVTDSFSS